jgi:spore coat protein U-like protein
MKMSTGPSTRLVLGKSCKPGALAIVMSATLIVSSVFAAAASDTATTSATVVTPIAINDAQNLSFGEFSAGSGGIIVLSTSGAALTTTGDVVLTGGTAVAAEFTITGEADATFSISISDDDLTHTDAVSTMPLATTHDLDGVSGNNPASGTLLLGAETIYVGGILTVGNAQTVGVYSGTITATVNYN